MCENCYGASNETFTPLFIFPHMSQSVCVAINFSVDMLTHQTICPQKFICIRTEFLSTAFRWESEIFGVFQLFSFFCGATVREKLRKLLNFVFVFAISKSNRTEGKVYSSASGNNSTPKKKEKHNFQSTKKERKNVQFSCSHLVTGFSLDSCCCCCCYYWLGGQLKEIRNNRIKYYRSQK